VRQQRSRPLIEAMQAWLAETLGRISGRSALAQAIRYALNHWSGLILFLDDGRLELGRLIRRSASSRQRIILPLSQAMWGGCNAYDEAGGVDLSKRFQNPGVGRATSRESQAILATCSDWGKPY
jgi:hypothetical protein